MNISKRFTEQLRATRSSASSTTKTTESPSSSTSEKRLTESLTRLWSRYFCAIHILDPSSLPSFLPSRRGMLSLNTACVLGKIAAAPATWTRRDKATGAGGLNTNLNPAPGDESFPAGASRWTRADIAERSQSRMCYCQVIHVRWKPRTCGGCV